MTACGETALARLVFIQIVMCFQDFPPQSRFVIYSQNGLRVQLEAKKSPAVREETDFKMLALCLLNESYVVRE